MPCYKPNITSSYPKDLLRVMIHMYLDLTQSYLNLQQVFLDSVQN